MANSTAPVHFKPTIAFNRGDTFVFGAWVCTADGAGSFQRRLTMQPNPTTGLVTLPEVVTGDLAGKFGEFRSSTTTLTSSSSLSPTRTRRRHGPSHASRLLSHRRRSPHHASTPRVAPASSAGPARGLLLHAGPARSLYPSTTRTPTPSPIAFRTPALSPSSTRTRTTSSTSGRTLRSPSPETTPLSFPCQGQPLGWL
jgi:hypothetical protein